MSSVLQEKKPMSVQTQQGASFKAGSTVRIEYAPEPEQNRRRAQVVFTKQGNLLENTISNASFHY